MSIALLATGNGLLLCWNFITSSLEPKPIEKLMMKINIKAE
jgi:hypothetical protein